MAQYNGWRISGRTRKVSVVLALISVPLHALVRPVDFGTSPNSLMISLSYSVRHHNFVEVTGVGVDGLQMIDLSKHFFSIGL
jgi:hypothetical protein